MPLELLAPIDYLTESDFADKVQGSRSESERARVRERESGEREREIGNLVGNL